MTVRARIPAPPVCKLAHQVYQYYWGSRPSNKLINEKVYQLAADPQLKFALPKTKLTVPYLEFSL